MIIKAYATPFIPLPAASPIQKQGHKLAQPAPSAIISMEPFAKKPRGSTAASITLQAIAQNAGHLTL